MSNALQANPIKITSVPASKMNKIGLDAKISNGLSQKDPKDAISINVLKDKGLKSDIIEKNGF